MRINDIFTAAVFIWIGFIGAISFMEAWLKFRAPGVTLSIGLGIGRLVFAALNKVEWVIAFVIIAVFIYLSFNIQSHKLFLKDIGFTFFWIICLLLAQTFWLLPKLDKRAQLIMAGETLPANSLHIFFVAAECIKVVLLIYFAIQIFHFKQ
ncbi:hypothetical protein [Hydrotalea sandarakina]|jgi:hypothetical protein|uniref:DUF4149 domain-containing protein n=1 Tax=Hydrotalea sandarakina TaxID=1004304 RepID=A0A2W7RZK6_9BACT|nr:hypothetical protein [Hydrotalea sandarakina]PZX65971.1 hypothetical protein LX80_00467 [Hydrotalea sandarakina]